MTVLITADLHLTDNPRDSYRHDFMTKTLPRLIKKYQVDVLYVLGDLTEQKDNHSAELVNAIADYFKALAQPITIIPGNHDYARTSHPFFHFLRHYPNVTWIPRPTAVGRWLFLPHTNNYKDDWSGIKFRDYDKVFCHQTFQGAKVGARTFDGIPTDIFPKGVQVYSGDIHTPQYFKPITYVGAPYTIDFGDDYKPRVILFRNSVEEHIPVDGPQKRLLDIKIGEKLSTPFYPDDIVKVRVQVKAAEMENWPKEKDRIRAWADKHGLELWQIQPVLDPADRKRMRTVIRTNERAQNDAELIAQYGKVARVSDRTLKTGLWLIQQNAT